MLSGVAQIGETTNTWHFGTLPESGPGIRVGPFAFENNIYIPNPLDGLDIALEKLDLSTGQRETIKFSKLISPYSDTNDIVGAFRRNENVYFAGVSDHFNFAYWSDPQSPHRVGEQWHDGIDNGQLGDPTAVSPTGRMVGHSFRSQQAPADWVAAYVDVTDFDKINVLPEVAGGSDWSHADSISDDNEFIVGGYIVNEQLDDIMWQPVVWRLNGDQYQVYRTDFEVIENRDVSNFNLRTVVKFGAQPYFLGSYDYSQLVGGLEYLGERVGLWNAAGEFLSEIGNGEPRGSVVIGDSLIVASSGSGAELEDSARIAIYNSDFERRTYTTAELFGPNFDLVGYEDAVFQTDSGELGIIAYDVSTRQIVVKTMTILEPDPVVSGWDGATSFVENSLPVVLDANSSVVDADSADFAGGTVTVSFAANGTAADRLSVRHVGNSAGQIGVSGNNISFGGLLIGTKSGGTNGSTPLVVTLNAAANSSAVTALLRAISFQNVSESPSTAARRVQVVVADGDGGTSAAVSKLVAVTAVNDAPVIAAFDGSVTYTENAVPVLVDSNASVSDPDGLNIGGGVLTVAIMANGQSTDRLAIRNVGTGAGQISVSGNTIKLGNVVCATFSGGTNHFSPLVVTLAPSATTTSATSILRALTFANVSENPSVLPRTIRVRMTDNLGALSAAVFKTVSVRAVNDAPVIQGWDLPLSTVGNANPRLLDFNAAVIDVDSLNFSGGKLTLWVSANAHSLDRLTVRSVGNSAGQIGVSGSSVRFGNVLIGTFVGGTSGTVPLVVTLNSSATTAAVTALLRSLTYKFAGTSSLRVIKTVSVSLSDGDGGLSRVVRKSLTLERTLQVLEAMRRYHIRSASRIAEMHQGSL